MSNDVYDDQDKTDFWREDSALGGPDQTPHKKAPKKRSGRKEMGEDQLAQAEEAEIDGDNTRDSSDSETEQVRRATGSSSLDSQDYFVAGKGKGRGFGGRGTKGAFLGLGIGGLMLSMLLGFFMYMTIYRSEHLRNLLWDYRFARFHYQMNKRIKSILASSESPQALNPAEKLTFESTTIYEKIRGYSPEKALNNLGFGDDGIGLGVEKTGTIGFRENRITSFNDPATGERIYSERASNIPDGARTLNTAEFADRLTTVSDAHLDSMNHSKFFQKQTRKLLRDKVGVKFGDRFKAYAENLRSRAADPDNPTDAEKNGALAESDADVSRNSPDGSRADGSMEDASEAANEDLENGTGPPDEGILDGGGESLPEIDGDSPKVRINWENSKTRATLLKGASAYTKVSSAVFVATTACMIRDINSSINDALRTRIEGPMRMIANQFGEAEQLKSNDNVEMDILEQRQEQYDGFEDSAAGMRLTGTKEEEIPEGAKMEVADLPFQFFGFDLSTIATFSDIVDEVLNKVATSAVIPLPFISFIPGTDRVGKEVLDELCKVLMDPRAQLGLAAVDIIVAAISIGSSKAVSEAVVRSIQLAISVGRSVGFQKIFFEYLLPKVLFTLAGSAGMLFDGDPQNGNKMDLGAAMLSSQSAKMAGGSPISYLQAQRDQDEAIAMVKQQKRDEFGTFASFNPKNPYSIASQFALTLPSDPTKAVGSVLSKSLGSIFTFKGISSFGSLINGKAKAQSQNIYFETYGMPVYGISDEYMQRDIVDNSIAVDGTPGRLTELMTRYEHCFTASIADEVMGSNFVDNGPDYSICGDADANALGLYIIDNCAMGYISTETTPNNCSPLSGAGDVIAESDFSTSLDGYAVMYDGLDSVTMNTAGAF